MINNKTKEKINKFIEDDKLEASSYEDQSCYNAAYCYGRAAGASGALNVMEEEKASEMFVVINLYSNENISEFDKVTLLPTVYSSYEAAKAAADKAFSEDKKESIARDAVACTLGDVDTINNAIYCIGDYKDNAYNCYHNVYLVIPMTAEAENS